MWNSSHHYSLLQQSNGNLEKVKKVTSPKKAKSLKLAKEQSLPKKIQSTYSHGQELWLVEKVILLCSFSHCL